MEGVPPVAIEAVHSEFAGQIGAVDHGCHERGRGAGGVRDPKCLGDPQQNL